MPDEENNQRADCCANQSRALIMPIPPNALSDEGGNECPCDPQYGGEHKPIGIVPTGQ
jgi:hypothetical protein